MTQQDIADTITLEDLDTIRALPVRYANAIDAADWDGVRAVMAPTASFIAGEDSFDGVESIIDMTAGALHGLDASQHFISNVVVDVTDAADGAATVTSYLQAQHVKEGVDGGATFLVGGVFTDQVARGHSGWQFTRRSLRVLWTEGNPAVHP